MLLFSGRFLLAASSRTSPPTSAFSHATQPARIVTTRLAIAAPSFVCRASYSQRPSDMETVDTSSRLSELRKLMKERNIDVYS